MPDTQIEDSHEPLRLLQYPLSQRQPPLGGTKAPPYALIGKRGFADRGSLARAGRDSNS